MEIHIWTFYNNGSDVYKALSSMIEDRYKPYGVVFEYEDSPEELQIEKIKDRKPPEGKKMTNAQKVIEWRDHQTKGKEFKIKELLKDTGLTYDSFKKVLKNNPILKKEFDLMKTSKKGYYEIN